jgi:hypothetical protein
VKLSFSVVLPSGWKVSYLPFGRKGGIPFAIASPGNLHGAHPMNLKTMKRAEVIEVKTEVMKPTETVNRKN